MWSDDVDPMADQIRRDILEQVAMSSRLVRGASQGIRGFEARSPRPAVLDPRHHRSGHALLDGRKVARLDQEASASHPVIMLTAGARGAGGERHSRRTLRQGAPQANPRLGELRAALDSFVPPPTPQTTWRNPRERAGGKMS